MGLSVVTIETSNEEIWSYDSIVVDFATLVIERSSSIVINTNLTFVVKNQKKSRKFLICFVECCIDH